MMYTDSTVPNIRVRRSSIYTYKCKTHEVTRSQDPGPNERIPEAAILGTLHATGTHGLQESTFRLKIPASPQEKNVGVTYIRGRKAVAAGSSDAALRKPALVPRPRTCCQ